VSKDNELLLSNVIGNPAEPALVLLGELESDELDESPSLVFS
jgi:hypothetical protein